jgi:membrane protein
VPALIGATAAGLLWAAAGMLFTQFVVYSTRLAVIYAGFAVVVTAFMWTYFGWLILLAGSLLAFYIQNPKYLRHGLTDVILSCVEAEQLALKIMYLIACGDGTREKRWSAEELASELGLPGTIVAHMTMGLEQGGLLRLEQGNELLPARGIGHITLNQILDVARRETRGYSLSTGLRIAPIDRLLAKAEHARRAACANRTLQDLLTECGAQAPGASERNVAAATDPRS